MTTTNFFGSVTSDYAKTNLSTERSMYIPGDLFAGRIIGQQLNQMDDVTVASPTDGQLLTYSAGSWRNQDPPTLPPEVVYVSSVTDFPAPVGNVITLEDDHQYIIVGGVDITPNRIVCGRLSNIVGLNSETSLLSSTIGAGEYLLTVTSSFPSRNVSYLVNGGRFIDADGTAFPNAALDWLAVNVIASRMGTIRNFANAIITQCAFPAIVEGFTFDGSLDTISFFLCLLSGATPGSALITLPATLTVTRRFRVVYSSINADVGVTGIDVDVGATIPVESYILENINFSGAGTAIAGVPSDSDTALFRLNVGIPNTAVGGQMYMQGNVTATPIAVSGTFYKVEGATLPGTNNIKYVVTDNRLTNAATIRRNFLVQSTLSFTSGNNNVLRFGIYDSTIPGVRTPSLIRSTANAAGRAENISLMCIVQHATGDYLELWVANTTGTTAVTVTEMNFIVTQV